MACGALGPDDLLSFLWPSVSAPTTPDAIVEDNTEDLEWQLQQARAKIASLQREKLMLHHTLMGNSPSQDSDSDALDYVFSYAESVLGTHEDTEKIQIDKTFTDDLIPAKRRNKSKQLALAQTSERSQQAESDLLDYFFESTLNLGGGNKKLDPTKL